MNLIKMRRNVMNVQGKIILFLVLIFVFYFQVPGNSAEVNLLPDTGSMSLDNRLSVAEKLKIDSIVQVLTLEEKVYLLHGNGLFTSGGVERLGLRELTYADGPSGVREEMGKNSWAPLKWTSDSATFFPTGSALAATWNPDLALKFGIAIGEESFTRKKDVLLAPAVNITRTPLNGRTYEYMSEDPFLNARLSVNYINGVQSRGVVACVKHYAVNNQETDRNKVSAEMDERTLREIYLPAFKASVEEAHVYSVMTAYNKFRGVYCAENNYLLEDILRKEWGFDGIVISDWGGTHSTVNSAINGLDVEMGSYSKRSYFGKALIDSVTQGIVSVKVIDEKVRRVLKVLFFVMKNDERPRDTQLSTPEHCKTAYDIAAQSIVLLKNKKNVLPMNLAEIKSIAVIGENAIHKHASGGFGAGVKTRYEITPLEGLKAKLGGRVTINYVQGYKPEYTTISNPRNNKVPKQDIDANLLKEAIEAAKKSDVAVLFVGTNREIESESYDRVGLNLPFGQDKLIKAISEVNPRTIVVVVAAAPVNLDSCSQFAPAIVWSWFNGSEGGNAIADVLTGTVNPSGKLPFTIPKKLMDSPAHALKTFPGESFKAHYSEGILVGYRWFDTKKIPPRFCFGYGLSYTTFTYSNLQTNKTRFARNEVVSVTVKLKNQGKRPGFETVQLYVSDLNGNIPKADKELKAFRKVYLHAGEEMEVTMHVKIADLAYFDEKSMGWVVNPGKYKIFVGSSSRHCKIAAGITIE